MSKKRFMRPKVSMRPASASLNADDLADSLAETAVKSLSRPSQTLQPMIARWQELSARDRLALSALAIFLLLFIGGYGGYSLHQAAHKNKAIYHEAVADYFWLRSQAGNIDSKAGQSTSAASQNPAADVTQVLTQAGINDANVVAVNGSSVQMSFSHASQAVVASVLAGLQQQGWQYDKLAINQDSTTKVLQVQGVIHQ